MIQLQLPISIDNQNYVDIFIVSLDLNITQQASSTSLGASSTQLVGNATLGETKLPKKTNTTVTVQIYITVSDATVYANMIANSQSNGNKVTSEINPLQRTDERQIPLHLEGPLVVSYLSIKVTVPIKEDINVDVTSRKRQLLREMHEISKRAQIGA
ncbi:hypothetical protein PROFUN_08022 [Planoprotostelium fungivorum]|uniref:Uncharacterized protein n=1 Tax=Planoprotostelium fungivorum TaxID=1890364 RepID=A0A2P6MVI3_9EUKA|nr:hypothetical protein PROFUN_08022 [Planoprotostelium fungivorum]